MAGDTHLPTHGLGNPRTLDNATCIGLEHLAYGQPGVRVWQACWGVTPRSALLLRQVASI